jgi:thioredoxin reductase
MNASEFEPEGTGSNLQLVMSRMLKYVTAHSVFFLNKHQGPGKTQPRQKTASTGLFSAGDVRTEEHVVDAVVEKDGCSIVE